MSYAKISIRFFNDREVRAVWDEPNAKWWFRKATFRLKYDKQQLFQFLQTNYWLY